MIAKDGVIISTKSKKSSFINELYFIFRTKPDSKFDDKEGKQYEYNNNVQNHNKVHKGANVILQRKIGNRYFFIGHCKIKNVREEHEPTERRIKYFAEFDNYRSFDPPKLRTAEFYRQMQESPRFNNQYSILPISKDTYDVIMENKEMSLHLPKAIGDYANILEKKFQVIFHGPSGTGKTYNATHLAKYFIKDNSPVVSLTFRSAIIRVSYRGKKTYALYRNNKKTS